MVKTAPFGYEFVLDETAVDLARAVRSDGYPDAQAFYTYHQFEAGYIRTWKPDLEASTWTNDQILRFAQPSGASANVERLLWQMDNSLHDDWVPFEPEGLPTAFGREETTSQYIATYVIFSKGRDYVFTFALSQDGSSVRHVAEALARDQYQRL